MARLWLPGDSDFALSQREPNLLVPGRKPIGRIRLRQKWAGRVVRCFLCDSAVELVSGKSAARNGTVYISPDIGGLSWATDGSAASYFDSGTRKTHALDGSFLHCDVVVFRDTSGNKGYLFGTVATTGSTIDDFAINTSWTEGESSGYVMKFIRGDSSGQNIRAACSIDCHNGKVRAVAFAKIGDSEFAVSTDGRPTSLTYGLQTAVTSVQEEVPGANYWYGTRNVRNSPSIGLSSQSRLYLHTRIIGNTTEAERNALSADPWGELFEPANSTPFLIGLPGGGGAVEITVPQGNLTLSTDAPTVSVTASASIDVPQADLVLSTTAPTVQASANVSIEVPQADLSLSSEPPAVTTTDNVEISPPAADLSLSSIAPTIAVSEDGAIIVPTAQLLLSTQAPTVELSNNIEITVPQGVLSLSTTAPKVGISWNIEVPQGALSLSSTAPSVLQGFNILVPGANLTLSPTAPVVATTAAVGITVPQGDLVLEGFAPTVEATGVDIWTQVGAAFTSWTEITSSSTVWTEI